LKKAGNNETPKRPLRILWILYNQLRHDLGTVHTDMA
jgi:hypothetical protein